MPEDIDYKVLYQKGQLENEQLRAAVSIWENQWKGFVKHRDTHFTISIPKPDTSSLSSILSKFLQMDMYELQKWYLLICLACIVAPSAVDIIVKLGEFKRGY